MSDNVVNDLRTRLLESLPIWYPDLNHGDFSLINIQEKHFRWSQHFMYKIRDERGYCEPMILVKLSRPLSTGGRSQIDIRPSYNALSLEYQALSLLHEHLGGNKIEGITAVCPLACFSDIDALVLEYMPGFNLHALLLDAGRPWAKQSVVRATANADYRVGRLLSAIHHIEQGDYPRKVPFNGEEYNQRLQEKSETLLSMVSGEYAHKRLFLVKQAVHELVSELQENIIVSYLHSDFNPDNLVQLPNGRVYTIDTTLHQIGPVEDDIAKFLVGVDTLKQKVLVGSLVIRSSTLDVVKQSFLNGYRAHAQFSSRILLLSRFLALIQRWIEVLSVLALKAPVITTSAIQRIRINPFMLTNLDHIWVDIQNEWQKI